MATINIRSDVKDPFYRYKMEKLQSKIEGKGNGIKTVIVNLSSVAASLARPGAYVIKYFGFELGAQTNSNPADDRWIINGAHEASKLQDYLDGFINKFVLCKKCKNPETDVVIKDGHIVLDCKACGQRSDVDLRLKLSGFILKNQPKTGKKNKADKKAARKAKQNGANGDENGHNSGSEQNSENGSGENGDVDVEAGSDDELTRRINDGALELDETETKDDEWTVDMSPEAVRARQQQLPDDLKQKLLPGDEEDEDGEGGGNSAYDQLGNWITSEAEAKGDVSKVEDVAIYVKAKEYGIEAKHRTILVLVQTIFDDKIVKQIPARASMLKNLVTSEKHEKALLGGVERFIGLRGQKDAKFYDETPKVLMALYNEDILPEEVLTKWGTKASKKYIDLPTSKKVRKSAEVFLNWLAEAESDEDSE
ncbi:related to translation initiation factor eIF5 [Rhynchosporium agropyri]|uniref:Related to translation initiation factor eIF5 n=3 Tax=Rhynchosporium TaxID=38037 RepID=A0A1E1MHR1_RHYSE|nr:related to translation initiation factor eIF5 [Rhynchosporium agropyri]CZT06785.1 related to translation initiation factor eIF5 [Rhynchosporium commune]CZT48652.1 related to translation initiation factor eIF5 [Rhynchosporium secalis]